MQRYGNDPAVVNVRLKLAPGAIVPESNAPFVLVAVCAVESLFIHVTVPPTDIDTGFGAYAVVVRFVAPVGIETLVPDPELGADGELFEPPHATASAAATVTTNKAIPDVTLMMFSSCARSRTWQICCPRRHRENHSIPRQKREDAKGTGYENSERFRAVVRRL